MDLPWYVTAAIQSGPVPKLRPVEDMVAAPMTTGERVIAFAHRHLHVPEGKLVGEPLRLDIFQIAFILAIFDNPETTEEAYLSIARRNGKTFLIAVILLAFIVGPLRKRNTSVASAAMSRDQAALVFQLMVKMLDLSPDLDGLYKVTPSSKKIVGLKENVDFQAMSSDAKTGHGRALRVVLLDEAGQIDAPTTPFVEMLRSSQGSDEDPLFLTISTQAPSDAAYLSLMLDAAALGTNPHIVSHVYTAQPPENDDDEFDLLDVENWQRANPGLDIFRDRRDLEKNLQTASEIPTQASGAMNLLLNMRTSQNTLFMSPLVWRRNLGKIEDGRLAPIDIGLDLSQRTDLTAAIATWREDDGPISVETHAFTPQIGLPQRQLRDRVPYDVWVEQGHLITTPGATVDYEWVAEYLATFYAERTIRSVQFDRYRIELFQEAAKKTKFYAMVAEWVPVGQGYVSMSPRLEALEAEAMAGNLRTGSNPVLNMAMSQAIATKDPAGNRKLDKAKSTQRIDPAVALAMGLFPNSDGYADAGEVDVLAMIG